MKLIPLPQTVAVGEHSLAPHFSDQSLEVLDRVSITEEELRHIRGLLTIWYVELDDASFGTQHCFDPVGTLAASIISV